MCKYLFFTFCFSVLLACNDKSRSEFTEVPADYPNWQYAQNYYLKNMNDALRLIDTLTLMNPESKSAKSVFKDLRIAFKKAEPYASYLNPAVGHRANGPALPVFAEDTERVLSPIGLQKMEESIYEGGEERAVFIRETQLTKGMLKNLKKNIEEKELNAPRFFIATHQQLMRIISLGISGFDTPVSHLGLGETAVSLESLKEMYDKTLREIIQRKNQNLDSDFQENIGKAVVFLQENTDFDDFDRYTFIRDYMNPITRNWVAIRKESGLWKGVKNKPFNFDAPTFFEKDAFNLNYFTPASNRNPSQKQIALGEKLFFDPKLSENGTMACATCHNPEKAYADAIVLNIDNDGTRLQRNTPSLINATFQKSFFWDGRATNLLDQISSVFTNEKEFNSSVHEFSTEILEDTLYNGLFQDAFGKIPQRNTEIVKAISSYIATLNGFDSKFDRNMRAEENTFTKEEKHGMNLFMGKALCATCHFMPLTNGTVPPFFAETEKEVIGVPKTAANKNLDDDDGFYWRYNEPIHKGMFKTPTVRNVEFTAPYMHNGVYATLEQVMDFYNQGGGGGMGFELEHQTLPFDELKLTDAEQQALVSFLKTLSDTKVDGDSPGTI
ncbi:hypothetical protein LCGC14_1090870 [marine sediment metagenome]|uniref:Cytochrome-c peroxidase n=2 Tax=root TaxID=1 RepID=A0A831QVS8_9FLAO|nr:cytochrome-c peroxidase [Pricia antarctica]